MSTAVVEAAINGQPSYSDRTEMVRKAIHDRARAYAGGRDVWCFVRDITDDQVVYQVEPGEMYQSSYSVDEAGEVTLGEPLKVKDAYTAAESAKAWLDAVAEALDATADKHGGDTDALLNWLPFLECLDPIADREDFDAPDFAAIVEAAAREAVVESPALRAVEAGTEAEAQDRVEGRVLEAKGTDSNGGRVYRVRIISYGDSKNGRRYKESVMREAVPLYEGSRAFDHHRDADELRSSTLAGLIGSYQAVEAEGDGLYADLHLLPSATHAAEALDASIDAQSKGLPPLVGISHDVLAHFKPLVANGRRIQEATQIVEVQSSDVVASPAAGGAAVRAVAGGSDPIDSEENDVSVRDMLAAIATATPEELAAVGLARAGTPATESSTPPTRAVENTGQAGDDGAQPKSSFMAKMLIRSKVEDAELPVVVVESLTAQLPDRVTEGDVDTAIAGLKASLAIAERSELLPQHSAVVTKESREKIVEGVNKMFDGDYSVFRSFKEAARAYTGYRPRSWGEDENRAILRECIGSASYDSAMRTTESMTTASWAEVLGDSITRRMVADYNQPALQTWRAIVSDRPPVNDFRTQRRVRVGGYGTLPVVAQGAPYQPLTSPTDEEATYAIEKKGGTEDITFEMIANDDLGAIRKIPQRLGLAASRTLHNFVWDFLRTNPTIYDSVALFHASHGNTTAVALSQTALSQLRGLMRDQTGFGDASNILSLVPRYLIVPNELEELAFQLVTSAVAVPSTPAGPSDTPNLHNKMEHIVVDYFTDANDWFVSADPAMCPTIEIGFYQGREEPELFTQSDPNVGSVFNSDTITYKIRHIYKGAVLDFRGFQRGTQ